jgi:hypothetical protein
MVLCLQRLSTQTRQLTTAAGSGAPSSVNTVNKKEAAN